MKNWIPRNCRLFLIVVVTIMGQAAITPAQDKLSSPVLITRIATAKGTGAMRLVLAKPIPNPAGCSVGVNLPVADILLHVMEDPVEPEEPTNKPNGRPRNDRRRETPPGRDICEPPGPSPNESLQREEIRLITDTAFLATIDSRLVRILVDGSTCSGDPAVLVVKGIVVEP